MFRMRKRQDPQYGQGVVSLSDEMLGKLDNAKALTDNIGVLIKRILDSDEFNPPLLPEVAISLSEMAGRPDVTIREVEETVQRDPTIAARVVAVANSAFYSRGTAIRSLRAAIMRLGLSEVRDVAFQVVAKTRIFRVAGYVERMRELFDAAQASGLISRKICQILRFESELAYLCGLLHEMGEAIILGIVGDVYQLRGEPVPQLDQLRDALDKFHAAAGAKVCSIWKLPETIIDAVMFHHRPESSSNPSQMATVVAITDVLLTHAGIGVEAAPVDPLQEPLFYRVNLTPDQVGELLSFAETLAEDSEQLEQTD